ncbi:YbaN family protein [Roseateles microcysteis]|uniref:YbaN family protein n=1 Tax=Roseateles microcysteis TaxID=3119057 RepID=UPI002FE55608
MPNSTPLALRVLWLLAGLAALVLGIVGIFVPLLPTTPFVLLAAFCFARASKRCEAWLLSHKTFGPMVRNWRARRAIPLRAKQLAWVMMTFGCAVAAWRLPLAWSWLPAAICLCVAVWMYRLPSK